MELQCDACTPVKKRPLTCIIYELLMHDGVVAQIIIKASVVPRACPPARSRRSLTSSFRIRSGGSPTSSCRFAGVLRSSLTFLEVGADDLFARHSY
eukprot:3818551-Pleurochrysis_carterae.AAC.5